MNINALRQRRAEAAQALSALLATHQAAATSGETIRGFSPDEKTAQAAARQAVTDLDELIASEAQRIELDKDRVNGGAASRIEVGKDLRVDKPFASFGEQLQAVVQAATPGGTVDPRLFKAGPTGGSTGVSSDAGFLVQTEFSQSLMEQAVSESQLLPLCDSYEAAENSDSFTAPYITDTSRATGSRFGGVQVYRRAEADTVAAKKPTIKKFEVQLEDMMALSYLTGREMRDARQMEQVTIRAVTSEFGFKIDDEIINGNGVGQMTGILNAACLVTQNKISGQAATTIKSGNISEMWTRMPSKFKAGAIWIGNSEITPQLDELSIVAGTAALEPRYVNYGPDGVLRIKGRPFLEVEQCAALGTVGDFMLVNLKDFLVLTKGGLKTDASMHVRFLYDENVLRFILPINGKPKSDSAQTPYKGSATKSAFVALQTRS